MTSDDGRRTDGSPFAGASPSWPRVIVHGFVRGEGPAVLLRLFTEEGGL